MADGDSGGALGAGLLASRAARERAEGDLAGALRQVRVCADALREAEAAVGAAREEQTSQWPVNGSGAGLVLARAGLQDAVDSALGRLAAARAGFGAAEAAKRESADLLDAARARERAIERAIERRRSRTVAVRERRRGDEGE